ARARPASAEPGVPGSSRRPRRRLPGRGANEARAADARRRSSRSRAWPRPARSRRGGRADGQPAGSSLILLLDEPQPVFDLRQAELELLVIAPGDQADFAEQRAERRAGALAHADSFSAPPAHDLVDELAGVVAGHLPAAGQLLKELVRTVLCPRHRAGRGEAL